MNEHRYPRIEINPAHCGIYKEYHSRGRRYILDGPYVEQRKIWQDQDGYFIRLQGNRVPIYPNGNTNPSPKAVTWETRPGKGSGE